MLAGSKCQKGHAGKWRSSASNLRPRHTKQRTGRISSGRELAQDWDCISLWATFYDSPISQVTLSDQSPTEGWPDGRPEGGLSCRDREQGTPRSVVGLWSSFQPGRYCILDFRKCSPQDTTGDGAQRRLLSSILYFPYPNFPSPTSNPKTPQLPATPTRPDNKLDTIS